MFKSVIANSSLVNETANDFFQNIYGDSFNGDTSFISTLRALVYPRMSSEDKISVKFFHSSYTAGEIGAVPISQAVRAICDYFIPDEPGNLYIHNFRNSTQENNYACLELMKSTFEKKYKGWYRLEKLTEFYQKQFYALCFINPDIKSVAIFIDNMDMRKMHYLQCSIFAFLPWYFKPSEGVTELEMALINSLREKTSDKYLEAIAKIAEQYDFRAARIRQLLTGFESRFEKLECENIKREIEAILRDINGYNDTIGRLLSSKNDFEIRLLGLENKLQNASEESEIMEYFLCNNKLVIQSVTDTRITFGVKTYIEYFDEDMVISAINNKSSYLYAPNGRSCRGIITPESIEKLMKAIFIDQKLKIKVCAVYEFNLNGSVSGRRGYVYGHEFVDCMPNPHIDGYSCLGNYQTTINQMLAKRDYIGAIEQCIASAKSLNFGDITVMTLFSKAIYNYDCTYNNKCIELPDGNVVTPKEAVKWLEEQEGGSDE